MRSLLPDKSFLHSFWSALAVITSLCRRPAQRAVSLAFVTTLLPLLTPAATPSDPKILTLPPVLYAVVGQELNLYYDSVILAPPGQHYLVKITCAKGKQQAERWVLNPTEAGLFPLTMELRDLEDHVVASAKTSVHVAPTTRLKGRDITFLAIGDSLTEASVYTGEILVLGRALDGSHFTLIGTHHSGGPPENLHEGYSGWKYEYFLSRFDPHRDPKASGKGTSPFVFDVGGKPVFDLPRYFKETLGGQLPNAITVFLGTNDVFAATDENRAKVVADVLAQAQTFIDALRQAVPQAKIGLLAPLPPAGQDAFGENYGTEFNAWTYRKNQDAFLRALLQKFGDRQADGIFFVPAYASFDSAHDYPTASSPRNARNPDPISSQTNAVHPSEIGYRHVADSIFAWLVNVL